MEDERQAINAQAFIEDIMLILIPDLHKVFFDDDHYNAGHGHAYLTYGVNSSVGALIIVRPDHCELTCLRSGVC